MPLPPTVSCFSKIQIGFTFLVPAHLGSPGQRAVKRVCVLDIGKILNTNERIIELHREAEKRTDFLLCASFWYLTETV